MVLGCFLRLSNRFALDAESGSLYKDGRINREITPVGRSCRRFEAFKFRCITDYGISKDLTLWVCIDCDVEATIMFQEDY